MGTNTTCINHPDRDASLRCSQCWRPLCNECAIKTENGVFCSNDCSQKNKGFNDKLAQNTNHSTLYWKIQKIKKIAIGITLLIIIFYGLWNWAPDPIPSVLRSILDKIFG